LPGYHPSCEGEGPLDSDGKRREHYADNHYDGGLMCQRCHLILCCECLEQGPVDANRGIYRFKEDRVTETVDTTEAGPNTRPAPNTEAGPSIEYNTSAEETSSTHPHDSAVSSTNDYVGKGKGRAE
jgi:hypothetical protein